MSAQQAQIVVAFDFSESSRAALDRALTFTDHVLHVLCVVDSHGVVPVPLHGAPTYDYAERVQRELAHLIEVELRQTQRAGSLHYFVHVRIGKPVDEILALAREVGADGILVGTKGRTGVERLVLGSVAERVVREAGCTVEVVRAKTYDAVKLLVMTEVEHHDRYVRPHRYSYSDHRVEQRPTEWPLY